MKSQKRRRKKRQDRLILNLLIIVTLVLVIFEGKLVVTMLTYDSSVNSRSATKEASASSVSIDNIEEKKPESSVGSNDAEPSSSSAQAPLAGLPANLGMPASSSGAGSHARQTVSNPLSGAIVPKASSPVDDSYFSDAVFIGDSRMEGFRNASGITQGRFFTSVGMSLSSMTTENIIQTPQGNITVAAALSGGSYKKIYIMLGANDLGEYDWNSFRDGFISVINRFREIQPDAIIYICSVIYVDEAKVASTDYVNNTNVDKINSILLEICEQQGYHYLDLNEFLSNGYGALLENASDDGVHIYPDYCKQMLDYLKNHYVTSDAPPGDAADHTTSEPKSETESPQDSV